MMETLGMEEVDDKRFMFLWHRVMKSGETEIIRYALDKALPKIRYQDDKIRDLAASALEKALQCLVSQNMDQELSYLRGRLCEKIKDRMLPAEVFRDCSRLLKMVFSETIRRRRFPEAYAILLEYNARLSPEVVCADDTEEIAQDFLRQVTDESTVDLLTSQMKEGVPFQTIQLTEEILESLDGDRVARKMLELFTTNDRAARMSSLRVLSRLGKDSIAAFSTLLSDPGTLLRSEGSSLLKDEQWHKVRNVIYVLGNIRDAQGIELLSNLSQDPDMRVRLEVVKALEKMGLGECVDALLGMLNDQDREVRKRVISALSSLSDESSIEPLMEHLLQTPEDARSAVAAMVKMGGAKSTGFLVKLLRDQGIGHLASRQKDEIRMAVFDTARQINSTDLADEIEKFVEKRGKGLKSLLVKDKVLESANRAVEAIRKRSHLHPATSRQH
jgi:HEAT repeat protein